jgi:excisionase family DNA binding protein
MTDKWCLSVGDLIRLTGLSRSTIYKLVRDQKIRAYKVGRRTVFKPGDFDDWPH